MASRAVAEDIKRRCLLMGNDGTGSPTSAQSHNGIAASTASLQAEHSSENGTAFCEGCAAHSQGRRFGLATTQEVSDYLRIAKATLEGWRCKRSGPPWLRLGKHVRYDWSEVHAWAAAQARQAS
ncbi:helix-turn-helix domain-containing protein [Rhodococcus sp. NPDC006774]|uniref:helix-turn-helix transcriptional regulator n=1 Tax=Rhodococcus sp. NPDC006774 TaxID=3157186 RepID=UPI0033C8D7E3